jgi:hypothetical protein
VLIAWLIDNVWLDALITFAVLVLDHVLKRKSMSELAVIVLIVIPAFYQYRLAELHIPA